MVDFAKILTNNTACNH